MKNKNKNKNQKAFPFIKNELRIYLLILVIVPSLLYFRVVNFGYSGLDDGMIVTNINDVQGSPFNLKNAFSHDAYNGNEGDTFYRPVQTISFMADAKIGGKDLWIYHLSNLIFHILTVIALFFFLKKIGIKDTISFLLSLLFAVHPLFTNDVAWIPARGDILLCLFSLLSFITLLEYFNDRKTVYIILHSLVFLLAMFSKETAVLVPALILGYLYFVLKRKFILKEILPFLLIWIITFGLFFILRQGVIKTSPTSNVFGIIPFLKNLPTIPIIFGKFFIPYNLCTMPLYTNAAIISGTIVLILFNALTFKFIRKEKRIIIWGWAWFLAFSVPAMFLRTYFATIGIEYFEYRAYLPVIGILIVGGFILSDLSFNISFRKMIAIAIPVLLVYSLIAFNHSADFADTFSFFNSAIKTNPDNAMAWGERGSAYSNIGSNEKALSDMDNAIRICPTYPLPYYNKGTYYVSIKDHYKAEYYFAQAIKYDTIGVDVNVLKERTYISLSFEKIFLRKFDEGKALLKKAISKYPGNSDLYDYLGQAYYYSGGYDSALIEYNRAVQLAGNEFLYYSDRGMTLYHLNKLTGALDDFNRALLLKPDNIDTWGSRGMTKIKLNDFIGAVSDLSKAISLNQNFGAAWYYRGFAYYKMNMQKEAADNLNKSMGLGYKGKNYSEKE
jgi:protein O-mannosyl-transferase